MSILLRRPLVERLRTVIVSDIAAIMTAVRSELNVDITALPDIVATYVEEYDYDRIIQKPAVVLFSQAPTVGVAMTGGYDWELPIDVAVIADPGQDLAQCHYNLWAYQDALSHLILSDHAYEPGYWDSAYPMAPVDVESLKDYRFGELARAVCYRYGFRASRDY